MKSTMLCFSLLACCFVAHAAQVNMPEQRSRDMRTRESMQLGAPRRGMYRKNMRMVCTKGKHHKKRCMLIAENEQQMQLRQSMQQKRQEIKGLYQQLKMERDAQKQMALKDALEKKKDEMRELRRLWKNEYYKMRDANSTETEQQKQFRRDIRAKRAEYRALKQSLKRTVDQGQQEKLKAGIAAKKQELQDLRMKLKEENRKAAQQAPMVPAPSAPPAELMIPVAQPVETAETMETTDQP